MTFSTATPGNPPEKQSLLAPDVVEERAFIWSRIRRHLLCWILPAFLIMSMLTILLQLQVVFPQKINLLLYSPTMCYVCNSTMEWQQNHWVDVNVIGYNLYNSTTAPFQYYVDIVTKGYSDDPTQSLLQTGNWFPCLYNVLNFTEIIPQQIAQKNLEALEATVRFIPSECMLFYLGFLLCFLACLSRCCYKGAFNFLRSPKAVPQGFVQIESLESIQFPLYRTALLWALERKLQRDHPLTTTAAVRKETARITGVKIIDQDRGSVGQWIVPGLLLLGVGLVCFIWYCAIHYGASRSSLLLVLCLLGTWVFLGVQFAFGMTLWMSKAENHSAVIVTLDNNLEVVLSGGHLLGGMFGVGVAIKKITHQSV